MEHEFWRTAWRDGKIGFHEGRTNGFLEAHADWLASCHRVLVPLCGKAHDLAFLAGRGHAVIGIELVEDAVRQFFAEHAVTPAIDERDGLAIYQAGAITVLAGDFFAATPTLVGPVDGVFDRGALVALPPALRERYLDHLRSLAPAARRELLVTIEYPAGSYDGPPFPVPEAEVRRAFATADVQLVEERPDPRGRAGGKMIERCYRIALS